MSSCLTNTMMAGWVTRCHQTHSWTHPWWWHQTQSWAYLWWWPCSTHWTHPGGSFHNFESSLYLLSSGPPSKPPPALPIPSVPIQPQPSQATLPSPSILALPAPSPHLCTYSFTLIDHCHPQMHHKIIFVEGLLSEQPCFKVYGWLGSQKAPSQLPGHVVASPRLLKKPSQYNTNHCLFIYLMGHISEPKPWLFSWSSL